MAEIEEDSLEEMTDAESYSADEVEDLFESKQNNCWKSSPELHGASSSKLEPDDDSTSVVIFIRFSINIINKIWNK